MIYRFSPFTSLGYRLLAQFGKRQYAVAGASCRLAAVVLVLWLGSCHYRQEQDEPAVLQKPVIESVSRARPAEQERDAAVSDLLPIQGDTLLAVKHSGGLALTIDAGMHWQHLHDREDRSDFVFFKNLTIDQHGVLWGLDSWVGIHEPSYARIASSADMGQTWLMHEFNIKTFFPLNFHSQLGQPLQVVAYNGTIYQLQNRKGNTWRPVQHFSELDNTTNDTVPDDSYFARHRFKFLKQGQLFQRSQASWEPVGVTTFVNELHDVCACNGRIYFTSQGSAYGDPPDYLLTANGPQRPADTLRLSPELKQIRLRCDEQGRLWLFNYLGVWQKVGNEFRRKY